VSYNETSFTNNPEVANSPGVLYILVLVNKRTSQRECVKIGITKGRSYKDISKRASGFKIYEHRVQKLIQGTLLEVYRLEQKLHKQFAEFKYTPEKFGGHTECFQINKLKEILNATTI